MQKGRGCLTATTPSFLGNLTRQFPQPFTHLATTNPGFPSLFSSSYINDLKRTLVAYRIVFGQPRQEDLLRFLTTHFQDDEELIVSRLKGSVRVSQL
ncbi:MAG TPA: hypothetical protein DEF89_22425 [Desulfosporosinus sp.]|nr:MAG: hypothetical protein JL57_04400 [Desulfosporosinus sp. BICA1-9]HBW37876.1 hypothetical protein [Desulfosporosinus sp.]